jgi:hypothetical protein
MIGHFRYSNWTPWLITSNGTDYMMLSPLGKRLLKQTYRLHLCSTRELPYRLLQPSKPGMALDEVKPPVAVKPTTFAEMTFSPRSKNWDQTTIKLDLLMVLGLAVKFNRGYDRPLEILALSGSKHMSGQ